jgi:hypothetical protein
MNMPSSSANWTDREPESLLWLASYPRSGNTFIRLLLANYLFGGEQAFDINDLSGFIQADTSRLLWEDFLKTHAVPATLQETWEARANFFAHYRATRVPTTFPCLKTHTANAAAFGSKGFDFRPTDRIIYAVRHPLDVLLSIADFNGTALDSAIDVMCSPGSYQNGDWPGALELRGSWAENVSSWLQSPPCPLLLVHYETLKSDTQATLQSILTFLGLPAIPGRMARAIDASRFDKVREQETANSFNEKPQSIRSGTFFRRGESLQWLRELSPDQAYRLADGCGPIMQAVGYTHPRDVFFDGRNALKPLDLPART